MSQSLKYGGIHDSHFEYIQTIVISGPILIKLASKFTTRHTYYKFTTRHTAYIAFPFKQALA